jgi:hypothetical protein
MRDASIIIALMEAVRTFETSVYFNETTRGYIPKSCDLDHRRCENLTTRSYALSPQHHQQFVMETTSKSLGTTHCPIPAKALSRCSPKYQYGSCPLTFKRLFKDIFEIIKCN